MKGFINALVYVENKGIIKTNVGVKDGKIVYIGDDASKIDNPYPYSPDQVVLPGFIDQHIHGADNADAMDGTCEALEKIASALAREGTTAFLATTMTQSPENISGAMKAVKEYKSQKRANGAEVLGIHLEGPFISVKHVGAQPIDYVAKPSVQIFKDYNVKSANNIKLVSLAPEVEGASELIEYLNENQIVASAGHTDATYNDIEKAVKSGLKNITHTYNVQKPVHHREVGTVGSAFLFDELNCEMICDLIHLSVPAIKLLIKNKPHDKITLITDSMRAKYLPEGQSELGGQQVMVKNGEARLNNGALAGSILRMSDAIKNLVLYCDVKFLEAVDYATINPAKNLNVDDKMGSIAINKNANFAILDQEFNVCLTVREGEIIFNR